MKISQGPAILAQPAPLWVIGSYDLSRRPNIMTASWCGLCCSKPPCVTVSLQKIRHSFAGILEHKAYTVSVPSVRFVWEADYFGIASGKNVDKFAVSGLTPTASKIVDAPYVEEFPLILECSLLKIVELGLHIQFIGEIRDVKVDEEIMGENGPDLQKLHPIIFSPGNRTYFGLGEYLGRAFDIGKTVGKKEARIP